MLDSGRSGESRASSDCYSVSRSWLRFDRGWVEVGRPRCRWPLMPNETDILILDHAHDAGVLGFLGASTPSVKVKHYYTILVVRG